MNIAVEIVGVTKRYHSRGGIDNVNVVFDNARLNLLVGPNGSGKTTLLKCIVGIVRFHGEIRKRHLAIGYAPEEYVLPEFMTIREFLVSVGRYRDRDRASLPSRIDEQLAYFDLTDDQHKPFIALSNGMKQKVNLIQAFLNHPKIILLDEPLKSLDEPSRDRVTTLIRQRAAESLILVSTHYPERFRFRNKRLIRLDNGRLQSEEDV
ncbi:MAG: ABC transporter ATP-binding protein [bacterium]